MNLKEAAVYVFEDNTYVATINMSTSNPQYGQHSSCMIVSEGTYQKVEGNFTTGKITITDDKNSMTVEIQDGQLKIKDTETPEVSIYIKQDNTKLPKPSEPTDMGGGDNGGDNGDGNGTQAFFPITYAGMTVDAWYSNSHSDGSGTTVQAVFLFDNDSLVVTMVYVPSQEAGGSTVCEIVYEGTFTLTEGNYDNGTAQVYDTDDELDFTVSIANGKLSAMSQTFTRQDNSKVPSPTWPTNMDS